MKTSKYIQDQKNSGFKVPKGYFESLDTTLLDQIKSKKMKHTSGFGIPEDYFSEFEVTIPDDENIKVISINDWSKWTAAAAIVAFAVLGALYIDSISPKENLQFSDLDNKTIENYLDYSLETPEEYIDFENTSIKDNLEFNISKLNDQDIIEYLNDKLDEQDFDEEN